MLTPDEQKLTDELRDSLMATTTGPCIAIDRGTVAGLLAIVERLDISLGACDRENDDLASQRARWKEGYEAAMKENKRLRELVNSVDVANSQVVASDVRDENGKYANWFDTRDAICRRERTA